jgi:hypothetical protein
VDENASGMQDGMTEKEISPAHSESREGETVTVEQQPADQTQRSLSQASGWERMGQFLHRVVGRASAPSSPTVNREPPLRPEDLRQRLQGKDLWNLRDYNPPGIKDGGPSSRTRGGQEREEQRELHTLQSNYATQQEEFLETLNALESWTVPLLPNQEEEFRERYENARRTEVEISETVRRIKELSKDGKEINRLNQEVAGIEQRMRDLMEAHIASLRPLSGTRSRVSSQSHLSGTYSVQSERLILLQGQEAGMLARKQKELEAQRWKDEAEEQTRQLEQKENEEDAEAQQRMG